MEIIERATDVIADARRLLERIHENDVLRNSHNVSSQAASVRRRNSPPRVTIPEVIDLTSESDSPPPQVSLEAVRLGLFSDGELEMDSHSEETPRSPTPEPHSPTYEPTSPGYFRTPTPPRRW